MQCFQYYNLLDSVIFQLSLCWSGKFLPYLNFVFSCSIVSVASTSRVTTFLRVRKFALFIICLITLLNF